MTVILKCECMMARLVSVAAIGFTLAGCLAPLSYRPVQPKKAQPVVVAPVAKKEILPPLPDVKANNATLAGIDTTGTGVRDDVYVWIYKNYSSTTKRATLTHVAKALQAVMVKNPKTAEEANKLQQAYKEALSKLQGLSSLKPGEHEELDANLYSRVINTPQRSQTFLQYNLLVGKDAL